SDLSHLALEIDEQRGMIAHAPARATHAPAPIVADVPEARPQLVIHEGLVETKAVAAVRRIPRVSARLSAKQAKRVVRPGGLQPRQPRILSPSQHRRLLPHPRPPR